MRRFLLVFGVVIVAAGVVGDLLAANPVFPQGDARRSMGNLRPKQPTPNSRPPAAQSHRGQSHHAPYHRPGYYRPSYGGVYRDPYQYDPYGYDYGPYDYPYHYPYPPYYIAPLYIPAEELYGPQAVNRFMGWGNWNRPPLNVRVIVPPKNEEAAEPQKPVPRAINPQSVATAWKYIGYGDAHFAAQKYQDAYLRYRKAARAAPQLAEVYFRQGYALMTTGRYDLAARAIRRGLKLDPGWPRSDFNHNELYGDNLAAKTAHVDAMAAAAEKAPHDADLLFLVGVHLHFDGQPDRAAAFFKRAGQLAGGDDAHIRAFTGQ